ncbi:MAG: DUF3987 domain-containing protein [Candidatus Symbiothrix sp.]|jgi:hypothetical protein|nr:DUF3987 domain-containing protein [Candidatus Symbiothrix sp.]
MYNSNNQRKGFPYQSVFPSILVTLIDELYEKYGYPIDFISTAIFTAFAASIGNSAQIKYNEAFIETASIFCVLIGKVNSGKSHPLSWAFKPFFKKNREESVKYQIAKQQYQGKRILIC